MNVIDWQIKQALRALVEAAGGDPDKLDDESYGDCARQLQDLDAVLDATVTEAVDDAIDKYKTEDDDDDVED